MWASRGPPADDNRVSVGIEFSAVATKMSFEVVPFPSRGAIRATAHVASNLRVSHKGVVQLVAVLGVCRSADAKDQGKRDQRGRRVYQCRLIY